MSKLKTAISLLDKPSLMVLPIVRTGILNWLDDKSYLRLVFRSSMGYKLNLKHPKTFSEKIQWLKLYDRQKEYIKLVDKISAKEYIANIIGQEYIIPTIGTWDSFDKIDFQQLPNRFVLKCSHDTGSIVVCRDKSTFDKEAARVKLTKKLKRNAYYSGREWPYKDLSPMILAEVFLEGEEKDLTDYKFYCFGGSPTYCQVITARSTKETIDFYDMDWKHQPFIGLISDESKIANRHGGNRQPLNFELMKKLSEKLSKGHPFCRIDFYEVQGRLYFGEFTLYPASGFGKFFPEEWNDKLGNLIELTTLRKKAGKDD